MYFKYNPIEKKHKSILGAVGDDEKVTLFVETDAQSCVFVVACDGQTAESYPMTKSSGGFFVCFNSLKVGLYWYHFVADGIVFGKGSRQQAIENSQSEYQLGVYKSGYDTPQYLKGGLIYQIFPDRFNKSGDFEVGAGKVKRQDWGGVPTYRNSDGLVLNNEFFGGNFKGIQEKLDYLSSLNVNLLYLNPINKAYSSHRYDTASYLEVDDVLGTESDLIELVNAAKDRGIRIMFDGVYNHVGADSEYFNKDGSWGDSGAYNDPSCRYYDWFTFKDYPEVYDCWWGFETLPSIKKDCIDFQKYITEEVISHNIGLGLSGVRLDVVDELDDNFVANIRKAMKKSDSENLIVGEVWEDATNKIAYGNRRRYFWGEELDSVMNYPLRNGIVNYLLTQNCENLVEIALEQINNYPKCALDVLMNVLSTHDSVRILTELSREEIITDKDLLINEVISEKRLAHGKKLVKLAFLLQFTFYGVPSVYYGDEAGMLGNLDPYNRRCFNWNEIDYEIFDAVKKLSDIRKENTVFCDGELNVLCCDGGLLIYERSNFSRQIIVAINCQNDDFSVELSDESVDLLTGKTYGKKFTLSAFSAVILRKNMPIIDL